MTNFTKLMKRLNLDVLSSKETINLKGGKMEKKINLGETLSTTKEIVGGGLPPNI